MQAFDPNDDALSNDTREMLAYCEGIEASGGIRAEEAVLGLLVHLDKGLRRGVTAMVSETIRTTCEPYFYLPAMVIGDGARQ